MNHQQLYKQLQSLGYRNPNYKPPSGRSTFVVIEFAENDDSVHFSSNIVDPAMPDCGSPQDYLDLAPMQRVALEAADIAHILVDGLSGVAIHGPHDEEVAKKCEGNKDTIVKCLRWLSRKSAIHALKLATDIGGHA